MSVTVTRRNTKSIVVETLSPVNRITVSHLLWMARELQEAVEEGMPTDTEVQVHSAPGVSGIRLTARASITQEIP